MYNKASFLVQPQESPLARGRSVVVLFFAESTLPARGALCLTFSRSVPRRGPEAGWDDNSVHTSSLLPAVPFFHLLTSPFPLSSRPPKLPAAVTLSQPTLFFSLFYLTSFPSHFILTSFLPLTLLDLTTPSPASSSSFWGPHSGISTFSSTHPPCLHPSSLPPLLSYL